MHRNATRRAAALAALLTLAATDARAAIDDGLVASYTFDAEDATDSSGSGNDGALVGDVTFADGWIGRAARFGGIHSPGHVAVPATESLSFLDDYTFALWFNVESHLSMDGYGQPSEWGYHGLLAKSGDARGLDLRTIRQEDGVLRVFAYNGRCCTVESRAILAQPGIGLGEWHHAAVTSGGGLVRLYLDGALAGELPVEEFDVNPLMRSEPLHLGVDQNATWYPLDGMVDEVRVYRRALAAEEVAALANRDLAPPEIAIATPADGAEVLLGAAVVADWSVADATSGVCAATGTVPSGGLLDTATVGAHAFAVSAADCAGNAASAGTTYFVRYAFGGFLPPLSPGGTASFRQQATVAVKFRLADAAGVSVTTARAALLVDADPTPVGSFHYDPEADQYVARLALRTLAIGTHRLTVVLDDGSRHSVLVTVS